MTKILLMNLPSGRTTTDFPPVGISRVIEGLSHEVSCEAAFYDLDCERPSFEKIREKIASYSPQVIGFSAILTPTYKYLKELSLYLKKEFPSVIQVLGGEMAVIHEIVMRSSAVDFCVVGQSEPAFSALLKTLEKENFSAANAAGYRHIKGLVLRAENGFEFTGPAEQAGPIRQVNFDLLSKFTDIWHYIHDVGDQYYKDRIDGADIPGFFSLFRGDNLGKKMAAVFASKGCVGRCTFCHRYYKGYKTVPHGEVTAFIRHLIDKYNVGMVLFSEENFGADKAATNEIISYLKQNGLNWSAGAVRVTTAKEETIQAWKKSGCVHINFGIESCSQKMLDVMEKRAKVEDNLNALNLCNKYDIATIISLVIGMPGETEETIDETIRNLSTIIPDNMSLPYEISINFFQAVPGTPGYEFAQHIGLIGRSAADQERYIESLYETPANEISHYLNFTDYEKEEVLYWNDYIPLELHLAYLRKHGTLRVLGVKKSRRFLRAAVYGLFPRPVRRFLLKYFVILRHYGAGGLLGLLRRKLAAPRCTTFSSIDRSLRLINSDKAQKE